MPPEMAVDMRHTKLKAEEAALIAGELTKPSWESRNEGIHERISFEDTIWGFDLAGGAFYKTPLRITYVKPDSRAEKAGIRPGDRLLRINGIDTTTLTIQEAHDIIVKSGIHLAINVTAPEDLEDAYYCYEDPIVDDYEAEQERLRAEEAARRRQVHARVSSYWSLQWPWVSKRRIIWRESNCYLVPSKYEEKHRDKFPPQPMIRREDDLVLNSAKHPSGAARERKLIRSKSYVGVTADENNPEAFNGELDEDEAKPAEDQENVKKAAPLQNGHVGVNDSENNENSVIANGEETTIKDSIVNTKVDDNNNVMEGQDVKGSINNDAVNMEEINDEKSAVQQETVNKEELQVEEGNNNNGETKENQESEIVDDVSNSDEILNEVLNGGDGISKTEEDNIIDTVLNEHGQNSENSEPTNER